MSDEWHEMDSQTEASQDKKQQKKTIVIVTSIFLAVLIAVGVWVAVAVVGNGTPLVGTYREVRIYGEAYGEVITLRADGKYEVGKEDPNGEYSAQGKGQYEVNSSKVTLINVTASGAKYDDVLLHVGGHLVGQYIRYYKLSDKEAQSLLIGQHLPP